MNGPDEFIGARGDDRERPNPLIGARPLPVLPNAGERKRLAAFHSNRVGLLRLQSLDCAPFEEAIDWDKASSALIGITEGRERGDSFSLGVDRLSSTIVILT